jgi:hypothetical protein
MLKLICNPTSATRHTKISVTNGVKIFTLATILNKPNIFVVANFHCLFFYANHNDAFNCKLKRNLNFIESHIVCILIEILTCQMLLVGISNMVCNLMTLGAFVT